MVQKKSGGLRIGILGGTFDPIHCGHVRLAQESLRLLGLDQVLFVVAGRPPHKEGERLSGSYHRFAMTALATSGEESLAPSALELDDPSLRYTVDLLGMLARRRPDDRFVFVAGSDSLREIRSWKEYGTLLREHCFVFLQRPGQPVELSRLDLSEDLRRRICSLPPGVPELHPGTSFLMEADLPDVSSTALRKKLAGGHWPSQEELPEQVTRYALKLRLYERYQEEAETSLRRHQRQEGSGYRPSGCS